MPSQTERAEPACALLVANGGPDMGDVPQPMALSGWPGEAKPRSDPSRDRFRHNLSRIMAERNLTQAGLARTMQVSRVAVHAWIWGTCFPETSRLIRLAQTLNVPIGMLLDNGSTPAPANEEFLLLEAFRKLPNTARLTLLADAYELTQASGGKLQPGGSP